MATPVKTTQDNKGAEAKVSPQENKEKVSNLDNEILQKILDSQKKMEAENASLREEIKTIKETKSKSPEQHYSELDEDALDDYLDVPVAFFAYTSQCSLHSYKVKGKMLLPPNGAIRFVPSIRYTSGTGFNAKVHAICEHKSQSKREVKYMEGSPDFGVKFYKTITEAKNYNHAYADILSKESTRVAQLSDQMVIAAIKGDPRLTVKTDIAGMRTELIQTRADDTMKSIKDRENQDTKKMLEDRNLLETVMKG